MEGERKTQKVLDMTVDGLRFYCVFHYHEKINPYHLYLMWYEYHSENDFGWHRKQVERYGNFISVIEHIRHYMHTNNIGFKDFFG
jgi:hypothetical protein